MHSKNEVNYKPISLLFFMVAFAIATSWAQVTFKTGIQLDANLNFPHIGKEDTLDRSEYEPAPGAGYQLGIRLDGGLKDLVELNTGISYGRRGYNVLLNSSSSHIRNFIINQTIEIPVALKVKMGQWPNWRLSALGGLSFRSDLLVIIGASLSSSGAGNDRVEVIGEPIGSNFGRIFSNNLGFGVGANYKKAIAFEIAYKHGLDPLHRVRINNQLIINGVNLGNYFASIQPRLSQLQLSFVYYLYYTGTERS